MNCVIKNPKKTKWPWKQTSANGHISIITIKLRGGDRLNRIIKNPDERKLNHHVNKEVQEQVKLEYQKFGGHGTRRVHIYNMYLLDLRESRVE